jgi:hypothetical protein
LKNNFTLECLGVKICFSSNNKVFINQLKKRMPEIVPIPWLEMPGSEFAHDFSVIKDSKSEKNFELYREAEFVLKKTSAKELLEYLESQIRSVIAEYAQDFIFLHAGVVSWKGKGIIIPGKTLSGKTTLVSELIKRDCEYLSDEFAVIDKNGYVHPFPKKLSVRGIIGEYKQVDLPVSKFGGKTSQAPVPIGFMLLTEYKKEKRKPRIRIESAGEGVMAGVANSISVRQNPKFVLEVLSVVANRAVILKGKRGDAGDFAEFLLNYLEKLENSKASSQSSQQLGKNFVVKV